MASKKRKVSERMRRLFFRSKKNKRSSSSASPTGIAPQEKETTAQSPALPWSPEDIMDGLHGIATPKTMSGSVLLMEVGGVDRGWILDFRNDEADISRYDIPGFDNSNNRKAPSGPPKNLDPSKSDLVFSKLPWLFYIDRKTFSKIETGKLSDTRAFVTGKIKLKGNQSAWGGIEEPWGKAKEKATERKKDLNLEPVIEQEEDDDEEDEEDEEARILATFKPEIEPMDPRKREFWIRHFGTDSLVAGYMFLIGGTAYMFQTILHLSRLLSTYTPETDAIAKSVLAHSISNTFAGVMIFFASIYFIKLSYPEVAMLMMYHVMIKDPDTMSFTERYFTANEMLIALWLMTGSFIAPVLFVALYELFVLRMLQKGFLDMFIFIMSVIFGVLFMVPVMPEFMRANNGAGTTYFFDTFWISLLRLKEDEERYSFWKKHVGTDMLVMTWTFAVVSVPPCLAVIPLIVLKPYDVSTWLIILIIIPTGIGSLLFVRASYPETMNTSIFFSSESEIEATKDESESDDIEIIDEHVGANEQTPLLV